MSLEVDLEVLAEISTGMREGATAIEQTSKSAPSSVDAGVMTSLVAALMGKLTESAGNLSTALSASAENLDHTRAAYAETDENAQQRLATPR